MTWLRSFILALVVIGVVPAFAVQPDEILPDQQLEMRARNLSRELRCMVCQNQSIDDSEASLARDLRIIVRERLMAGDSDQQVLDYLTARYGDFVLLNPPFKLSTALLWLLPVGLLLIGAAALIILARRQQKIGQPDTNLTAAEKTRLTELANSQNR
jgi:cytochrome c-type biogenesis protein CcmH